MLELLAAKRSSTRSWSVTEPCHERGPRVDVVLEPTAQVVEHDDVVAAIEQAPCEVGADEPRSAGNQGLRHPDRLLVAHHQSDGTFVL